MPASRTSCRWYSRYSSELLRTVSTWNQFPSVPLVLSKLPSNVQLCPASAAVDNATTTFDARDTFTGHRLPDCRNIPAYQGVTRRLSRHF